MENSRHISAMEFTNHQQQHITLDRNINDLESRNMEESITSPSSSDVPTCTCGSSQKLSEVIKVNHYWQKDYTTLMEENNQYKARLYHSEKQRHLLIQDNRKLRERLQQNESETLQSDSPSAATTTLPTFTLDDIEALKQQLLIYKEDFLQEKEDRTKLSNENSEMKVELQKAHNIIEKLTQKNNTIKENYKRVSTERDHIIHELRRLTTTTLPFLPITSDYTISSANSPEALRSGNVLAHSGKISPRGFYGGHVERDGLTLKAETRHNPNRDYYSD